MLSAQIRAGLMALVSFFSFIGTTCANIIVKVSKSVFGFIFSLLSKVFKTIGLWIVKKFKQPFYDIWCYILTPFAHALGAMDHTRIQLKKTKELGIIHGLKTCCSAVGKIFTGTVLTAKFLFNYIAPAISIAFLLTLINHASTLQYTISVEYNGNDIGVITSEADFNQAQALVQDKITYTEDDKAVLATPKFSVRMMQESDAPVDTDSLSELMMNASDVEIVSAYGLYINGSLVGIFDEEQMNRVKTALEARLAAHYNSDVLSAEFEDKIEISQGRYIKTNLTDADEMLKYISGSVRVKAFYVVEKGDSVSAIAKKLGYTRDELIAENPSLGKGVKTGDLVTYYFDEPNLSVLTYHFENYDQIIETAVQYVYDNRMEKYCEVLKQHGSDGRENITALVSQKDGVEVERTIINRYSIEAMVPQIYITGTKENTYLKGNTKVIDRIGTFVWPVGGDGGYISSLFGYRKWDHSNHKGIDIPAKRGTDIYAAQSGTVTFAGTYSSYGKLVIIDHGGGYETYYGHQSSIDVEKGDKVEKGDVIGHVGMTGSASGNHLHFELRYHDDRLDPFLALGGRGRHEVRE